MSFFNKTEYVIKRFLGSKYVQGHYVKVDETVSVKMNIQPISEKERQTLPEGERFVKRIKSFGKDAIYTTRSDGQNTLPADELLFEGEWYICEQATKRQSTPLSHYRGQYVIKQNEVEV